MRYQKINQKNRKKYTIFLFAVVVLLLFIAIFNIKQAKENFVIIKGKKIVIDLADSEEERSRGLMFRTSLKENAGMLFIFDKPSIQEFWMKNTLIPLEMIFIDENKKIINIETAQPCTLDPCLVYKSTRPALYVLEVNAGFAERNTITPGDSVEIQTNS